MIYIRDGAVQICIVDDFMLYIICIMSCQSIKLLDSCVTVQLYATSCLIRINSAANV